MIAGDGDNAGIWNSDYIYGSAFVAYGKNDIAGGAIWFSFSSAHGLNGFKAIHVDYSVENYTHYDPKRLPTAYY